ncbi:hypothetical protein BKP45_08580 [Anaerobacillus alkalidiazotrophicus]|uniref:DUF3953 domain-containing protein n=1 Tax=Anaerobacillus alkalidiazotrophicus TaxID=472963 RepID=A0A1S2M7H0_9BACI|nr:hypothetical protein [Anaerobacillus alkalidiazotrophicus]OIJ20689.1 hypothetical protein BKP45_08580 [Anaerobacillus alkalidiazotrophicus]
MRNTLQYEKAKSYIKVLLLVLTILSTSFVIWAGFTGRESIFPFLLSLTLFLSISNLQFDNENPERKKLYKILLIVSCLSVALAVANLIV